MITEKEIREQFPITGEVVMEENKTYEETTRANFHRRQGAIWLLQQQVKVEPEVKVQIAEMVERHLVAHEQMKEQYLDKNLEMYSKAGGAILALKKLLKDLRKSNLSA